MGATESVTGRLAAVAGSRLSVWIVLGVMIVPVLGGCSAQSSGRVTFDDIPSTSFMRCVIPSGQPTWANVTLIGGEPPFHAEWVIDGKVDSTDTQRATPVPGGTELAIRVTLTGVGQVFRVRELNRHGLVATDTWTNDSAGVGVCGPDGKPKSTR